MSALDKEFPASLDDRNTSTAARVRANRIDQRLAQARAQRDAAIIARTGCETSQVSGPNAGIGPALEAGRAAVPEDTLTRATMAMRNGANTVEPMQFFRSSAKALDSSPRVAMPAVSHQRGGSDDSHDADKTDRSGPTLFEEGRCTPNDAPSRIQPEQPIPPSLKDAAETLRVAEPSPSHRVARMQVLVAFLGGAFLVFCGYAFFALGVFDMLRMATPVPPVPAIEALTPAAEIPPASALPSPEPAIERTPPAGAVFLQPPAAAVPDIDIGTPPSIWVGAPALELPGIGEEQSSGTVPHTPDVRSAGPASQLPRVIGTGTLSHNAPPSL